MDDYVTIALLAATAFFVAISFGLLYRYRQVSQRMSESTDLGRDLWSSLEQRLKKQDERILDIMARFDVVQSRMLSGHISETSSVNTSPHVKPPSPPISEAVVISNVTESDISQSRHVVSHTGHPLERRLGLDETQAAAIKLLGTKAMSTREITDALGKSREHTARVMKTLFERNLVIRDDSKKPFVYELTEDGRRYLSAS